MFCCSVPYLLGTALTFAGLSYFLYIPLHDGIADHFQVRYVKFSSRWMKAVGSVAEMLGFDSALNVTRNIGHWVLSNNLPPQIDGVTSEDFTFDGTPVRLYRPALAKTPSPCVIYIHGGGWTTLSVDIYDEVVGELTVKTGYIFVSIDYSLAPEHPFPVPFDESFNAVLYLLKHAEDYGIDKERIGIAGDSAGGNLAAAVALKLSETDGIPELRFQWLIYPALQAFTFQLPAHISNDDATPYFLQTVDVIRYWCWYMGFTPTPARLEAFLANNHTSKRLKQSTFAGYVDYRQLPSKYHNVVSGLERVESGDAQMSKQIENVLLNPFFSPLMKSDLSNVPPAFVLTGEYDVLRDDGLLYAERMKRDGVEVEVYNAPKCAHGFMFWSTVMPKYSNNDKVADMFVTFAKKHM